MGVTVLLWGTLLCGYDICFRRLPNWLTLPGAAVAISLTVTHEPLAVLGGLAWAALYRLGRTGGGDVKLALSLGTVAALGGWWGWWLAVVLASLSTAALGLILRAKSLPHGPSMLCAAYVSWLINVGASAH